MARERWVLISKSLDGRKYRWVRSDGNVSKGRLEIHEEWCSVFWSMTDFWRNLNRSWEEARPHDDGIVRYGAVGADDPQFSETYHLPAKEIS